MLSQTTSLPVTTGGHLLDGPGPPSELAQILPTPAHFEQTAELVTEAMIADAVACGPDLDRQIAQLQAFADTGVDELFVQQIGHEREPFFAAYREHVLPQFGPSSS